MQNLFKQASSIFNPNTNPKPNPKPPWLKYFFFLSGFSFILHSQLTGQQGNWEANFSASLPLPTASQTLTH